MSLEKALSLFPHDTATKMAMRDVLALLVKYREEWLTPARIVIESGLTPETVTLLLDGLLQGYVVKTDNAQPPMYRFDGDVGVALEIDSFVRRIQFERAHVEMNVALFRRRRGGV